MIVLFGQDRCNHSYINSLNVTVHEEDNAKITSLVMEQYGFRDSDLSDLKYILLLHLIVWRLLAYFLLLLRANMTRVPQWAFQFNFHFLPKNECVKLCSELSKIVAIIIFYIFIALALVLFTVIGIRTISG